MLKGRDVAVRSPSRGVCVPFSQQRTTTFINPVTTLLLSALPYPSTMSAPETPPPTDVVTPPPSDAAAQGDMLAQQDLSPVNTGKLHGAIPAPATPVLPVSGAESAYVSHDLALRRSALDIPFYAEADVGLRDGPLEVPRGLLPDLAQIQEALEIGFDGLDPLQPAAITLIMKHILHNLATKTWGAQEIERLATSFDRIQFVVQEIEAAATEEERDHFYRETMDSPRPPCSIHTLLMFIVEHGYAITNILHAASPEGYKVAEIVRLVTLSDEAKQVTLNAMRTFHAHQMLILDGGMSADDPTIEAALEAGDTETAVHLQIQKTAMAEFDLLTTLAHNSGQSMEILVHKQQQLIQMGERTTELTQRMESAPWTSAQLLQWRHQIRSSDGQFTQATEAERPHSSPVSTRSNSPETSALPVAAGPKSILAGLRWSDIPRAKPAGSLPPPRITYDTDHSNVSSYPADSSGVADPYHFVDRSQLRQQQRRSTLLLGGAGPKSMEQEEMDIARRRSTLPAHLRMSSQHTTSVSHGVKREVIDAIKKYDGSNKPVTLRLWVESLLDSVLQVPKGADNPALLPYLMYMALDGRAKECIRVENARLKAEGKIELHFRHDKGDGIMDALYNAFVHEEENKFLLNLMQVVRISWRDASAPDENLREFHMRFQMHLREAQSHYASDTVGMKPLEVLPELSARLLFVAGLPMEVQSMITSQQSIAWADPALSEYGQQQMYEAIFNEYELRRRRGEKLTPQVNYTAYPNAVLENRAASITSAYGDIDAASSDPSEQQGRGYSRKSGKGGGKSQSQDQFAAEGKQLLSDLRSMAEGSVLDKMISVFKSKDADKGPLQLVKVARAMLNLDGVDFRTYKKISKIDVKLQNVFHCLMAVLYHKGRKTGPGHRLIIGRRQILPNDDDDKSLYDHVSLDNFDKLNNTGFELWRDPASLQLQKEHWLRIDGKMQPACLVCSEVGHHCGMCLRHLNFLKAMQTIPQIPAVASTVYTFGQAVTDVCMMGADQHPCDAIAYDTFGTHWQNLTQEQKTQLHPKFMGEQLQLAAKMVSAANAQMVSDVNAEMDMRSALQHVTSDQLTSEQAADHPRPLTLAATVIETARVTYARKCDALRAEFPEMSGDKVHLHAKEYVKNGQFTSEVMDQVYAPLKEQICALTGLDAAKALDDLDTLLTMPAADGSASAPGPMGTEVQNSDAKAATAEIQEFVVSLQPSIVNRHVATLYYGPKGIPMKTFFDTGATRTLCTRAAAKHLGLPVQQTQQPLRMRRCDNTIASDVINTSIQQCTVSALNGEVHDTIPEILLVDTLPDCDILAGRDMIFQILRAVVHEDRLECYTQYKPTDSRQLMSSPSPMRKTIPFEAEPVGTMTMQIDTFCSISELVIADDATFHPLYLEQLEIYVAEAMTIKPKLRNKAQREAISVLQSSRQDSQLHPMETGPLPVGLNSSAVQTDTPVVTPPPRDSASSDSKSYSRLATMLTYLSSLLALLGGIALQPASVSVSDPVPMPGTSAFGDAVPNLHQFANVNTSLQHNTAVVDAWYTDMGFHAALSDSESSVPSYLIKANADMASVSGAKDRTDHDNDAQLSEPITREKWYPLLRYEALTKPAGDSALRKRLKMQGYDVSAGDLRTALDVLDPQTVESTFKFPPACEQPPAHGPIPAEQIDSPWEHLKSWAAAVASNTSRFTCLLPISVYDPPAHHKRLRIELNSSSAEERLPKMNPRPIALGQRDIATQFAKGLLAQGRWRKSTSPVASPLLIVPKPKKHPLDPPRYRLVCDYRRINKLIKHKSYRLPACDQLWYSLDNAKYISTADAADGYWLAPLDLETSYLTAVDTPLGRCEWTCLPMGLQPASGWFQSFLEDALSRNSLLYTGEGNKGRDASGQLQNFVSVYQDDLIWWSADEDEHKEMTERVLDAFSAEKLYLNPNKLNLGCKYARYLGCVIGNSSLSLDPNKVSAIESLATPTDTTGVRQLVGMTQFWRRWIPGYSSMVSPLTDMLRKDVKFKSDWGEAQDAAVRQVKAAVSSYPVLRQYDPTKPVVMLTDASTVGVAGCLAQLHDGHLCAVSYCSHRLTEQERNYPITELEGLAILHSVRCHRHFLLNNPFTVRILSDHQPLQWVQKVSTASGRLSRWLMELAEYDFRIEFIPGKVNDVADALSRLVDAGPAPAAESIEFRDYLRENDVMVMDIEPLFASVEFTTEWEAASAQLQRLGGEDDHLNIDGVAEYRDPTHLHTFLSEVSSIHALDFAERCNFNAYKHCPQFSPVLSDMQADQKKSAGDHKEAAGDQNDAAGDHKGTAGDPPAASQSVSLKGKRTSLVPQRMLHGMYVIGETLYTATGRVCIPVSLREELMSEMHMVEAVGHRGTDQMLTHMQRRFYWPGMQADIQAHVERCVKCGESKSRTTKNWGGLRPHLPPTRPFTHYSIDFMFGFPSDGGGPLQYDGIMVCVDMFSKRVIAIPVWEAAAAEVMAEQFYRAVVCNRGTPVSLVSDRDSRFTGAFWRKLWALHRTSLKITPAYSPQADGQTERMNRLLQEIMRTNVQADQLNWLELLDGAVMAINNAPIAEDRPSPFEVETGLAMKLPIDTQPLMGQTWQNRGDAELVRDTMQHDDTGAITDVAPYPALYEHHAQQRYEFDHPERMRAIHQMAREQMLQAKLRMQDVANQNRPQRTFEVGDYVMLRLDHIQLPVWSVAKCKKLRGKYFGSFPVVAVHSPLAIELRLPSWMHVRMHPVFHPMYLKLSSQSRTEPGLKNLLEPIMEPADFPVDKILAHRTRDGKTEYLVQWQNCSYLQSTFEPESGLAHAQKAIAKYQRKRRQITMDAASAQLLDPRRLGMAVPRLGVNTSW